MIIFFFLGLKDIFEPGIRAANAVPNGMKQIYEAEVFGVCRRTIGKLANVYKKVGSSRH